MNRKKQAGQALVEFVIILPIFIFMILAVIDIGKILYMKNNLESRMEEVITLYESKSKEEITSQLEHDAITLNIENENDAIVFELAKETDIVTPGLNLIFRTPYYVTAKRVIYNE